MDPATKRKSVTGPTRPRRGAPGSSRRTVYEWVSQIADPGQALTALRSFPAFIRRFRRYRKMTDHQVRWKETIPRLHDATATTPFDAHYFYMSAWAMRRIREKGGDSHVDIAGPVSLVACLAGLLPTTFIDYRPLQTTLAGLIPVAGDLLHLPLRDRSVRSLSCLHVAEHVGLGRYGDPLDPEGTRKACAELARVLAPDGTLLFAVPVGRSEVHHFNAHRVHRTLDVIEMFPELSLIELSLVDDDGSFSADLHPEELEEPTYGCGMFRFRRT